MNLDPNKKSLNLPKYDLELLKLKGFQVNEVISGGSFSKVCKAKMNAKEIAVKIINLEETSKDYRTKFLPRELYSLKKLRHPYIICVFDIFTIGNRIYIFMEFAYGGDILDLLKNGPLSESNAKKLFRQIADALKYIHSVGIAHRDIKCENVLLNKEQTVAKLTDFGFSRTCFDNSTGRRLLSETFCGSAAYVAPEVLKAIPYNPMIADIWSLGIVLYVMVNNRLPFSDADLKKMLIKQIEKGYQFSVQTLSKLLKDLISRQLDPNVQTRIKMTDVMTHKWLN